jgi:hypothetical protein
MHKHRKGKPHKRHKDDLYPTPLAPVLMLQPWLALEGIRTFAELCCGPDQCLVRHAESLGLTCVLANDICFGQDALTLTNIGDADCVLTNTPHTRAIMHPMITKFVSFGKPVWLLIDYNWSITRQSAPYLPCCSDIIPLGRVIWIEGTNNGGTLDYAWYRFHINHNEGPRLHWYGRAEEQLAARASWQSNAVNMKEAAE